MVNTICTLINLPSFSLSSTQLRLSYRAPPILSPIFDLLMGGTFSTQTLQVFTLHHSFASGEEYLYRGASSLSHGPALLSVSTIPHIPLGILESYLVGVALLPSLCMGSIFSLPRNFKFGVTLLLVLSCTEAL